MSARIVTANRLRDGAVVYLTVSGAWSQSISEAAVAATPEQDAALLQQAHHSVAACDVVDTNLIDVTNATELVPVRYRERIRNIGPSVRPDLARPSIHR